MESIFTIKIVAAHEHMPEHYQPYYQGHRALQLLDQSDNIRGELVWRLATGNSAEITEFGLYNVSDRRKGWGSRLLQEAISDITLYFQQYNFHLRRIYLFCEERNEIARKFYELHGFCLSATLTDFYIDNDALLYIKILP